MLREFRAFIERGNVLDLAVAVVMGAAFGRVVTAFVDGILTPPLGLLIGQIDFSSLFVVLDRSRPTPASLAEAKELGIPVLGYGAFITEVINLVIVGFAVFVLIRQFNRLRAPATVTSKPCPRCLSTIPRDATRCSACCADLVIA